jgi:succinate-acetate transporter protein
MLRILFVILILSFIIFVPQKMIDGSSFLKFIAGFIGLIIFMSAIITSPGHFIAGHIVASQMSKMKNEKLKQDSINRQFMEKLNNIEKN